MARLEGTPDPENTHTEYGGGEGSLGRFEGEGSRELTTSERARVMRQRMARPLVNNDPVAALPVYAGDEPEHEDIARQRADLEARTNKYNREVEFDG